MKRPVLPLFFIICLALTGWLVAEGPMSAQASDAGASLNRGGNAPWCVSPVHGPGRALARGGLSCDSPGTPGPCLASLRITRIHSDATPKGRHPADPMLDDGVFRPQERQVSHRNLQAGPARRVEGHLEFKAWTTGKISATRTRKTTRCFKENYPAIFGREPPFAFFPLVFS